MAQTTTIMKLITLLKKEALLAMSQITQPNRNSLERYSEVLFSIIKEN